MSFKARGKTLVDLSLLFKDFGIGRRFTRNQWPDPDCYWTVTRVNVKQIAARRNRGKAWGKLTWKGKLIDKESRISGVNKRQWSFIGDGEYGKYETQRVIAPHFEQQSQRVDDTTQHTNTT
mmetsp:Transcript_15376/g.23029  ORF Transcript_15376/g.23029 Transcript_15376/m.23029 type:complete len:121 (+) Transcript_15376:704-1066(+)